MRRAPGAGRIEEEAKLQDAYVSALAWTRTAELPPGSDAKRDGWRAWVTRERIRMLSELAFACGRP